MAARVRSNSIKPHSARAKPIASTLAKSVVAKLSVDGAEFWVGDESPEHFNFSPESLGGATIRIILTVADPDAVFQLALAAGAKEVYPIGEEHGWRIGRVVDPFGHHWEVGHPLAGD